MRNLKLSTKTVIVGYTMLVAVIFTGCKDEQYVKDEFEIMEIDSCEYVVKYYDMNYFFSHKGNCKYCAERSKNNCH